MTVWNRKIVEITSIPKADMQGRIIDDIFENVEPQAAVITNTARTVVPLVTVVTTYNTDYSTNCSATRTVVPHEL